MVSIILHCRHCQSEARVRHGHAANGKQQYRWHTCGRRSRENPPPNAYAEARREEMLHAEQERSSLRGRTRTFGVSRAPVSNWIKKSSAPSSLTSHPPRSGPRGRHFHDAGPGRTVLVCAQKSAQLLDLGIAATRHASGCGRRFCRSIASVIASPTS